MIACQQEQWRHDGGKWIPYAGTYLRGERWADVHEIELTNVVDGKMWWETSQGIEAKGLEFNLTLTQFDNNFPLFKQAVFIAAGHNIIDMRKQA